MAKPKRHYEVDIWSERDRASIVVYDNKGEVVAEYWDEEVEDMVESGFFVGNRGKKALAESVLEYLEYIKIIKPGDYTYSIR